ncbi:hypothetical protein BC834DRAFT_974751 [Gloeopeniophorella convolvens]|nr:hypothetical protein BC834DRAFT_974751 [Gloeopeniophorella convolvens]
MITQQYQLSCLTIPPLFEVKKQIPLFSHGLPTAIHYDFLPSVPQTPMQGSFFSPPSAIPSCPMYPAHRVNPNITLAAATILPPPGMPVIPPGQDPARSRGLPSRPSNSSAWDEAKKKLIDEKVEKLRVEKGTNSHSSIPHIHAPHARAASMIVHIVPCGPRALVFQAQEAAAGTDPQPHSAFVSPQLPPHPFNSAAPPMVPVNPLRMAPAPPAASSP